MRAFLFIILSIVLVFTGPAFAQDEAPFDNNSLQEDGQILAFVGRKIFVRKDSSFPWEQDKDSDEIILHLDSRYQVRYEIIELIAGKYEGRIIDFHAYDHYGIPRFSRVENALIFIHDGPDNRVHSKYNFFEVDRTTDGDWAACGNAYVQYDPEEVKNREPLEPITFLDPVTVNIPSLKLKLEDYFDEDEIVTDTERAEVQAEIDEDFKEDSGLYQPPIWKREGDTAICQLGTRADDLFKFQIQTRFLPAVRRDICKSRHITELDALGKNWKAKRQLIEDCVILLEIQNVPNAATPSIDQNR